MPLLCLEPCHGFWFPRLKARVLITVYGAPWDLPLHHPHPTPPLDLKQQPWGSHCSNHPGLARCDADLPGRLLPGPLHSLFPLPSSLFPQTPHCPYFNFFRSFSKDHLPLRILINLWKVVFIHSTYRSLICHISYLPVICHLILCPCSMRKYFFFCFVHCCISCIRIEPSIRWALSKYGMNEWV